MQTTLSKEKAVADKTGLSRPGHGLTRQEKMLYILVKAWTDPLYITFSHNPPKIAG